MLYHLGVMQWIIKHFAWFFFKTMNVSGAEAVVAAASPFIGQSESACLVRPYVDIMTESEIHLILTSGELFLFSEFDDHWGLNKQLFEGFLLLLVLS
jgi:nucleoside permease NupC